MCAFPNHTHSTEFAAGCLHSKSSNTYKQYECSCAKFHLSQIRAWILMQWNHLSFLFLLNLQKKNLLYHYGVWSVDYFTSIYFKTGKPYIIPATLYICYINLETVKRDTYLIIYGPWYVCVCLCLCLCLCVCVYMCISMASCTSEWGMCLLEHYFECLCLGLLEKMHCFKE